MKTASVTPIFKSGNPYHPNNYRPMFVLPVISKIRERALANKLMEFLNKHNILFRYQDAFRKKN